MLITKSSLRRILIACLSLLLALGTGAALAAPAGAATGTIRGAGTASVVKGSYVVVLRDGAALKSRGVRPTAAALRKKYGGVVGHTYSHALSGFEVKLGEAAAKRLAADPAVKYVQRNGIFRIQATQSPATWGIDRIDQRDLPLSNSYTYSTTASNVHAYVIDTGIRTTHTEFGGRATSGYTAINDGNGTNDCNGHGTHVSGTVGGTTYGVAKGVSLVAVRVLDCSGSGTTAGVVAGVDWVTANAIKPAVANMSLGGGVDSTLDAAVQRSIASGVTYGIAAGNSNANACNSSPARVPEAITVGATTSTDARASFSNYGTCLDIFAPGSSITSSWNTSDTATNTISGTSMATPHVVGAAALVLAANPSYSPQQVRDVLVNNATTGKVTSPGTGSPNRLLYTGTTTPPPPGCTGTNGTDVSIPDAGAAVYSTVTISGCGHATALATSTVEVHIVHTYRGDLVIDAVAPDGSTYRLKNSSGSDGADNVDTVYSVNLSSEATNGAWRLKVQDVFAADTGYINSWTLTV
jgi:subtilisin family serine protease